MEKKMFVRAYRVASRVLGMAGLKFFLCFGNVLHLIRDESIEDDKDLDFGIFYEELDQNLVIRGMEKWEYGLDNMVCDDYRGKAMYMSFVHTGKFGLPPIDIFAWYLHDGIRYHTFDTKQEKKKHPSKYVFKGVEAKFLPTPKINENKDPKLLRTFFGKWNQPVFDMEINAPFYYGSLLDTWYPNWLKKVNMQSASPYVINMNSCSKLARPEYVAKQLEESKIKYQELRETLR